MAVKSAERVLKIFDLLENYSDGLTNKDISIKLNYAPSSTLAILQTMCENGYLTVDGQKRYALGGRLVRLGAVTASHFDIVKTATPYLKELMKRVSETSFLGILSQDKIVYIAKENSRNTINTNAQIGSIKPVYCTGLGKAILAFMPEEERESIIKNLYFERFTDQTVKDADSLRMQLKQFEKQGYAVDDQEIEENLYCFAVPIYDAQHHVTAAVSVSGPKERMINKKNLIIKEILGISLKLSQQMGMKGD